MFLCYWSRRGENLDACYRMISYFEKKLVTCTPHGDHVMSQCWYFQDEVLPDEQILAIRAWVKFLNSEGPDSEQRDEWHHTALLVQLHSNWRLGVEVPRLLLELGADTHATDAQGRNALQLAMLYTDNYEGSDFLVEKLSMLIDAGVDIHHRDSWGNTPSYDARFEYDCWLAWCTSVERNGKEIFSVVKEEGESWL